MEMLTDSKVLTIVIAIILALICLAVILILAGYRRRLLTGFEDMDGEEFERHCAELLKEAGFGHVEITPPSHDFGADILADRDGISYAFQCKYYDKPVGVHAVQEVYAGRDYYGCMVGVVITNNTFTAPAKELAESLKILLWDVEKI